MGTKSKVKTGLFHHIGDIVDHAIGHVTGGWISHWKFHLILTGVITFFISIMAYAFGLKELALLRIEIPTWKIATWMLSLWILPPLASKVERYFNMKGSKVFVKETGVKCVFRKTIFGKYHMKFQCSKCGFDLTNISPWDYNVAS